MKTDTIHVGDFVLCRSKYYRDQLQLQKEPGLVIEVKRSNFKVLYPDDKRCWLPLETISKARPEMDYSTLLQKMYYIVKKLHADECEIVSENGVHRLSLRIDTIGADMVDDLRRFLGDSFISLNVVPEGMAFMQAEIQFQNS